MKLKLDWSIPKATCPDVMTISPVAVSLLPAIIVRSAK